MIADAPSSKCCWTHEAPAPAKRGSRETATASTASGRRVPELTGFVPPEPKSFAEASLTGQRGRSADPQAAAGARRRQRPADCRPVVPAVPAVGRTAAADEEEQVVVHRGAAPMNDYQYQLTDVGRERARRLTAHCTYFGAAPVSLKDYIASVTAQSLTTQHPTVAELHRAFDDLLINKRMLRRLGPAINSGRGLFLYGAPGNGKTSIAERVTRAFGQHIWIPRALGVDGEIIRLFDPSNHEELPLEPGAGLLQAHKIDKRWVRIRRPTIVVGGELTMDNLEVTLNTSTGISEAPMQLKSNCGTLVIDDFGRQRMSTDELLNRWIVPLEKRYDYLNLPNGKKIQVPFDQLIIFSTNLRAEGPGRRRVPAAHSLQDRSQRSHGRGIPRAVEA